ncbi:MAG: hypothetical protein IIC73_09000, partial [Armatimonadetes bacterium]|nr:hypothetical protein [Armatimonadota bacterium]
MALTLAEMAKNTDPFRAGFQKLIVEEEPLMDRLPWKQLPAGTDGYTWREDGALPTVEFRAVNAAWNESTGVTRPRTEHLSILGGEIKIDQYIIDTGGNVEDMKMRQFEMKGRAARQKWLETFFEGDTAVDLNSFDGLRVRHQDGTFISANNIDISSDTNVATLTLADLDQGIDAVVGGPSIMACNPFLRRKINALVRAAGQAQETVSTSFGKKLSAYADVPIVVIRKEHDDSSILGFDEDPGDGGDDAASIYMPRFGDEDFVFGLLGNGGAWEAEDRGIM